MSLWNQLTKILPEVLPPTPEEAINGTALLSLVKDRLIGDYAENTIRVHFSRMARDSSSPIARVDNGHGYYLRAESPEVANRSGLIEGSEPQRSEDAASRGLEAQQEERFRAFLSRFVERDGLLAMPINHARARRAAAGINKWKFPDLVLVDWDVDIIDEGDPNRLDPNLMKVKESLGEPLFHLSSVEVKVSLDASGFREAFFQCVSNSKWAHSAILAVAMPVSDKTLLEELRRLGTSYDVTIVSYSISAGQFDQLPSAGKIMDMTEREFDELAEVARLDTIVTGRPRDTLDWEYVKDLRVRSPDFVELFEWLSFCRKRERLYTFKTFKKLTELENGLSG